MQPRPCPPHSWLAHAAAWLLLCLSLGCPPRVNALELTAYESRYYTIHTSLSAGEARQFGRHMDAVFAQYTRRFSSFRKKDRRPMPLYLLRTRDQYMELLAKHGINGSASGGMFFVQGRRRGLATWTDQNNRTTVLRTLQHEGFHQFAYSHIGPDLPIWVNEGLAEYFEDGLLVADHLKLGLANQQRVETVKQALRQNHAIDFDRLLQMDSRQWHHNMIDNPTLGQLQYDQSWSIVYFLIHGDRGRYRRAFEKYLVTVSKGRSSAEAFRKAFGTQDTADFNNRWRRFARQLKPDPISTTVDRMVFLGQGLLYLHRNNQPMPTTLDALRVRLQNLGYRMTRTSHRFQVQMHASDENLYRFPLSDGGTSPFTLLEAQSDGWPPRIAAIGAQPEPTLEWQRDGDDITPQVSFR